MSRLGWIDFSPDDRNKVSSVLSMLAEPGTLDELGIGQIRDAYANALFPGISTIQTRAKYFITIPRIIRDFQSLSHARKKQGLLKYLKEQEDLVARVLYEAHPEGEVGIIGRNRIDSGGVDRKPSVIYWNGLRTFGIIKTRLSLADYCRRIDAEASNSEATLADTVEGSDDKDVAYNPHSVSLPDKIANWLEADSLRMKLTRNEADFLKEKLITTPAIKHSVPAELFRCNIANSALAIEPADDEYTFDLLASLLLANKAVSNECKRTIQLAAEFSQAIEGPHIRYNLLLARLNSFEDSVKQYEAEYAEWLEVVKSKCLFASDCAARWLAGAVPTPVFARSKAGHFVRTFAEVMQAGGDTEHLDRLVKKQAQENKGSRSLLNKKQTSPGWAGIRRLDYRWGTARQLVKDIQVGLNA